MIAQTPEADGEITGRKATRLQHATPNAKRGRAVRAERDTHWVLCALDITVHERWMNGPFLCVTKKFWGEPCELRNSP